VLPFPFVFIYLVPHYTMSKISYRSDIFSFNVMLVELITGRKVVQCIPRLSEDTYFSWVSILFWTWTQCCHSMSWQKTIFKFYLGLLVIVFYSDENITWHTASSKRLMLLGGIHTCLLLVCCSDILCLHLPNKNVCWSMSYHKLTFAYFCILLGYYNNMQFYFIT
jgi:hypothetical protein